MSVKLASTGSYLPAKNVPNEKLHFPPNTLPLIKLKTGVEARRICEESEKTSDISIAAAKNCLEKLSFDAEKLDTVIVATSTPDRLIPSTAAKVAAAIGTSCAVAFDINSVCSGGLMAMGIARSMIESGAARNVLAIGADTYSKFLNPKDFSTFPYFGDGAGAVLLSAENGFAEVENIVAHTNGNGYEVITIKAGAGEIPANKLENPTDAFFKMNGREVFEFATTKGPEVIRELLAKYSIGSDEITSVVLHQANINIIKKISQELGIAEEKFFSNLQKYGNTASASVLIALDECLAIKKHKKDDKLVMACFGGGLTWGASLLRFL